MPCLQFELATAGLRFVTERAVPILYKGMELDAQYRIDLLVENLVVVEVKSVDHLLPVHQRSPAWHFSVPLRLFVNPVSSVSSVSSQVTVAFSIRMLPPRAAPPNHSNPGVERWPIGLP